MNEKYNQKNIPPENWRSVYLLLKENLPTDRDPNEDDLLLALNKISTIPAEENFKLSQQVKSVAEKLKELEKEIQRLRLEPKPQIIIQEKEKNLDDYGIGQIVLALIKKIFLWFIKK